MPKKKHEPSLRARALGYLARREHSRAELLRKLAPHAESREALDALADDLERRKLLSDARYAEARVHTLSPRYGAARIAQELRLRGVNDSITQTAIQPARETEIQRARAVWLKRYGAPAADALQRAKQQRFLQGRGFSFEVIRRVVAGTDEDFDGTDI
jgi:regulatory protein